MVKSLEQVQHVLVACFVADGAVWVSGLRPKGKDFDLDPVARVDTGRWLEVTGTVHREGPMVWLAVRPSGV